MDNILTIVSAIEAELTTIKTEIEESQKRNVFSYARSKTIRKSALEIAKGAKDLRITALEAFKGQKGE